MTAIIALLVDAYRELNARKLFWLTMALTLLLVLAFGSVGFNEQGISMLYGLYDIESPYFVSGSPLSRLLYQGIFSAFMVTIWLAWGATILALISTTSIFPDFLASGTVELVLSKPIRRVTLFIVKYVGALLFVILQVTVFCVGAFICIGLRIGDWDPTVLLGIPLITLFFSYIYSVNVLIGVVTRSALAALLLCLLFWFVLFSLQASASLVTTIHTQWSIELERKEALIANNEKDLDAAKSSLAAADERTRNQHENRIESLTSRIEAGTTETEHWKEELATLGAWKSGIDGVLWCLPKTGATTHLLTRAIESDSSMSFNDLLRGDFGEMRQERQRRGQSEIEIETQRRVEQEQRSTSAWGIVGSSAAFELVILIITAIIFVRRDY